jgi:type III restriction enzyme
MELKNFQRAALDTLTTYLERARISGDPNKPSRKSAAARTGQDPPALSHHCRLARRAECLFALADRRGKTLLAAHTVAVAGRHFLERDFPWCCGWCRPTPFACRPPRRSRSPAHPYRAALDDAFDGRVSVFDVSEIAQIRPQDLTDRVAVIVTTIQTLRVSNTEGRKAYAHSENFEPHFAHIPATTPGLERKEDGQLKFSFVNLMAFHRPLVIVDEAHKAGTNLSFDMLAALRPSCIVEFTATPNTDPRNGSNVLFRASAAEVKAAQMIKLPIILTEHPDWRAAVHDAIETRPAWRNRQGDAAISAPSRCFRRRTKGRKSPLKS